MDREEELNEFTNANKISSKFKIILYGKQFLMLSLYLSTIWLIGFFQINLMWIIVGIIVLFVYYSRSSKKEKRFLFGLDLSLDEKNTINNFANLPSWVFFPDIERVEWINKIARRLWPSISKYIQERLVDKILPKLKKSFNNQIKLEKIHFGDSPPKIGGIKFYDNDYLNRVEMTMDMEIYFYGNGELKFKQNKIQFGIKHLEIKAKLRLQMSNFVPKPPFVGAITLTLLENPVINFEFTNAAAILNLPGFNIILRETISDIISQAVVIPNRIPITFIHDIDIRQLIFPMPEGMIRINIIEGASLKASDTTMIGKKTSDPYVVIRVGAEKFKTKVIDKNLNPKWNEYFDAIVDTKGCQKIEFQVFDKDLKNKDDYLGEVFIEVENVFYRGNLDTWLTLEKVNTGTIHVNLTWLTLSSNPDDFDAIEEKNKQIEAPVAVGYLYFAVDCAKNLKKINYVDNPSAFAEITVGNKQVSTSVIHKSQNPIWENAFNFYIQSIYSSDIKVEIKDDKTKTTLGNFSLPIANILCVKNMEKSETISLQNADGIESTVSFYAALRALQPMGKRLSSVISKVSSSSLSSPTSPTSPSFQKPHIAVIHEDSISDPNEYNNIYQGFDFQEQRRNTESDNETTNDSSLTPQLRHRKESLSCEVYESGRSGSLIYVTIRYSKKKVFYIVVHKIENMNIINEKNPKIYIKLSLRQSDGKAQKWRTKTMPYNINMTYDETFQLLIEKDKLSSSTFYLEFKLERQFSLHNKTIGKAEIEFRDWDMNSVSKWYPIQMKEGKSTADISRLSIRSDSTS